MIEVQPQVVLDESWPANSDVRNSWLGRKSRICAALAVGSIALTCATAVLLNLRSAQTGSTPLALTVEPANHLLKISWNDRSPLVRTSEAGVLTIEDGATRKVFHLEPAQLRGSGIVYARSSGNVNIRLEVVSANGSPISESARVIAMGNADAAEASAYNRGPLSAYAVPSGSATVR